MKMKKIVRMWMYAIGLARLQNGDVWLASFPKAGSTWVRFVLSNIISIMELDGQEVDFHNVADMMPSLGRSNFLETDKYNSLPRFIKTHQPYRPLLFQRAKRSVYVLRDPRDVMVSYYYYRHALLINPFQGEFSVFVRHPRFGLQACIHHYNSWKPYTNVTVQYEAMHKDTFLEFQRLLSSLGVSVQNDVLQLAVDRAAFSRVKAAQEKTGLAGPERFNENFKFARKGKTKQWVEVFSDNDLQYYQEVCDQADFHLYP